MYSDNSDFWTENKPSRNPGRDPTGPRKQGCQMALYFQTKNPNLGKFGGVLQLKMLVHFIATWSGKTYSMIVYSWLYFTHERFTI
jgi:hypothetical protein